MRWLAATLLLLISACEEQPDDGCRRTGKSQLAAMVPVTTMVGQVPVTNYIYLFNYEYLCPDGETKWQ